jgi:hypothetical protein
MSLSSAAKQQESLFRAAIRLEAMRFAEDGHVNVLARHG